MDQANPVQKGSLQAEQIYVSSLAFWCGTTFVQLSELDHSCLGRYQVRIHPGGLK